MRRYQFFVSISDENNSLIGSFEAEFNPESFSASVNIPKPEANNVQYSQLNVHDLKDDRWHFGVPHRIPKVTLSSKELFLTISHNLDILGTPKKVK